MRSLLADRAPAQLLGSYHVEREPVARGVLNLTDRITRMATAKNAVVKTVRDLLLPVLSGVDFLEGKIADRLAELAVNYRSSPIVENHGAGTPRAGDRAPDAELRDANGKACRLFELFREPRHILLLFLGASANEESALLPDSLGDMIRVHRITRGRSAKTANGDLLDISGNVHSLYHMLNGGFVLVRPDGYIAFRCDRFDTAKFRNYLTRIFGVAAE